ncbi:hypothetical protein QTQ03_07725 [Micromonospora sp. WMMA1363]|uniref:hypothetical protein n=1 Tax=Micromonospora sp. WMMA1363 TaxID=3053985 RepID=UPI00259CBFC9|nr:hypothetical protein [Micromonospora sp. WMMA1363]MDM4719491.1 hypothetical protein [Micromonospora sp. WMMA1363]
MEALDRIESKGTPAMPIRAAPAPDPPGCSPRQPRPCCRRHCPGLGTATAGGGQDAAKLFDDSSTTQLTFASGTPQISWMFRGGRQKPTYYTLTSGASAGDPTDWRLQGSNDGISWTTLDHRRGQEFRWRNQTRPFKIHRRGEFAQFRLVVTTTTGAERTDLAEVELLAGGDVELGGGAVAVSTANDVHATTGVAVSVPLATVTGLHRRRGRAHGELRRQELGVLAGRPRSRRGDPGPAAPGARHGAALHAPGGSAGAAGRRDRQRPNGRVRPPGRRPERLVHRRRDAGQPEHHRVRRRSVTAHRQHPDSAE